MNWSLGALIAEVPLGVVTVTSTVPVPAGAIDGEAGGELITTDRGARVRVPKSTAVAPVKPVPVTVTALVPPLWPVGRADPGDRRGAGAL